MAIYKNQLLRFRIYDDCLAGGRYVTIDQFLHNLEKADLGISVRTFYADFELFTTCVRLGYLAPIEYCHIRKAYHYTRPYSISKITLTTDLERALTLGLNIIEQTKNTFHILQLLSPTIAALLKMLNFCIPSFDYPLVEFQPSTSGNIKFWQELVTARLEKRVLSIRCGSVTSIRKQHFFHCYQLKELNHEWFAIGWMEKQRKIVAMRVTSIHCIEDSDHQYVEPTDRDALIEIDVFRFLLC